jgi:3',5'-nucleoside bisphosphate phosphatase
MGRSLGPLLCELHAHSTWSDGELAVSELVDLYGSNRFDVLCVTDHVVRSVDRCGGADPREWSVHEGSWGSYLADVEREARRAWRRYGMLVVPGVELTFNDPEPTRAAHAVAVGLRAFVSVDDGIDRALDLAAKAGAAVIAAHPCGAEPTGAPDSRLTRRFACDESLRDRAHRFELFNRAQLFGWVAEAGLPAVASGDFHRPEHLTGWKTLLPTAQDETSVVAYLRSQRPVYLARFEAPGTRLAA